METTREKSNERNDDDEVFGQFFERGEAPAYSPLATRLFQIDGVTGVFFARFRHCDQIGRTRLGGAKAPAKIMTFYRPGRRDTVVGIAKNPRRR